MNAMFGRLLAAGLAITMMASWGCRSSRSASPPGGTVTINGRNWQVELATTAAERYQGLSDRENLPTGRGMLFIYPRDQMLAFCMRDCLIPLDIAFIGSDKRVVKTYTMEVEPYGFDTKNYYSDTPAQYALEVPKGALKAAGVKVGDKVEFSRDIPPAAKAEPGP